ncbi:MAG TPA: hypothetical protein VF571_21395 [Pyrinomonadaceae bacterium]
MDAAVYRNTARASLFWKPSLFFISLPAGTITVFVWLSCLGKFDCKQFRCGASVPAAH